MNRRAEAAKGGGLSVVARMEGTLTLLLADDYSLLCSTSKREPS
jgi:hypothetical protein